MNKTPANSPASLSAFKKKFPTTTMNTPPPSPCSTITKTPKGAFVSSSSTPNQKSGMVKRNNFEAVPDIAKFHVPRPFAPSTSEKSESKFSFHIDKNQAEENCKKPSHAKLGLNISSLNSSFYDLSKALTNPISTNSTVSSIPTEKTPPESFIATRKYKVPPRSSTNQYLVSFETAHKKGVVCSSDLDPSSKPIKKTEALMEKRKILAQKLSLASRGASFSPISRVVKKEGSSFDSFPSTPTSTTTLPDEAFINVIQSGCVNDIMSKDIERTAQEGNQSVKDLLMNGYFLHSGRCVDLEALQQDICTQILMEDANANVEELASFFKLNVVLQLSYLPCTSYFNVPLERTCSMVGNVVKGLSIENDMKNVKAIADRLNEEFSLLETKSRDGDPNLVYSMKTANFPISTYIEKEADLQTSIEKLGSVHGCIITCILRMKLNGISQKELSKLPRCFRNADQYFLAKLICNDNLNRQFLSQGIWQLLSLELFDNDVNEATKQEDVESDEITSYFDPDFEPADNLEGFDHSQSNNLTENPNSGESEQTPEESNEKTDEETSTAEGNIDISSHQREAVAGNSEDEFSVEPLEEEVETLVETKDEQSQTTDPVLSQEETTQTDAILDEPKSTTEASTETTSTEQEPVKEKLKEEAVSEPTKENQEEINEDNISTDSSVIVEEPQEEVISEHVEVEPVEEESSAEPQVYIQQTGQEIFNLQGQMIEVKDPAAENQETKQVEKSGSENVVEEGKEAKENSVSSTSTSQIQEEEKTPSEDPPQQVGENTESNTPPVENVNTENVMTEEIATTKEETQPTVENEEKSEVTEPIVEEVVEQVENNTKEQAEPEETSLPSTEITTTVEETTEPETTNENIQRTTEDPKPGSVPLSQTVFDEPAKKETNESITQEQTVEVSIEQTENEPAETEKKESSESQIEEKTETEITTENINQNVTNEPTEKESSEPTVEEQTKEPETTIEKVSVEPTPESVPQTNEVPSSTPEKKVSESTESVSSPATKQSSTTEAKKENSPQQSKKNNRNNNKKKKK
ncbi:predicted protein [Naegleria gruberi]|uniref:Predicted protein n=1 Tax=Naegleria gruberi TaxID=5762 RepID=D2V3T5_NAEGR|nr:uncharacterized protein NAEGRDRAFT_46464 [Naegleria gruberi]EFC48412.1 predicted protein [Naegleria gruberi]|eukprot:XP_002681156.1 predicted protein [Naegleria gruberi strain NEG-M]